MKKQLKIALIHDVFIEFGGAERVLLSLLKIYPNADVYSPLLSSEGVALLEKNGSGNIFSSFFNKIPLFHSASIVLKPFLYWYWESLDLSRYDLVISSSHSFSSKAIITSPDTVHISYIHTSPRYLYTEYNETRIIKKPFFKQILLPLLSWLRTKDYISAQRPDLLIANSKTVQKRIQKYYRRESLLIYPPVKIPKAESFKDNSQNKYRKYYLSFSRLAKQKSIYLAIQACNRLKVPLLVVGKGSEEAYLRSIAGPTIEFTGFLPDSELEKVFSEVKALIYCSKEEDFGMIPVEVMAYGLPVIGYSSGGVKETIMNGKTGVLFDDHNVESLVEAMKNFENEKFSSQLCKRQAEKFSEEKFVKNIKKAVTNQLKNQQ